MSGLFSCCGYDSGVDKESTLNVRTGSFSANRSGMLHPSECPPTPSCVSPPVDVPPSSPSRASGRLCATTSVASSYGPSSSFSSGVAPSYADGSSFLGTNDGLLYSNRTERGIVRDDAGILGEQEDQDGASSVVTLSPEQKKREKLMLQSLVKSFAGAAVGGVGCKLVRLEGPTAIEPVMYFLDTSLENFTVSTENRVVCSFHMSNLQEVYSYDELLLSANTEFLTREAVIRGLTSEQRARLIILEHTDSQEGSYLKHLVLMENSPDGVTEEAKDNFIMCMKILRLYLLTASNNGK